VGTTVKIDGRVYECGFAVKAELERLRARERRAVELIEAAFGEYACAARKVLSEEDQQKFETNFAIPARCFIRETKFDN
jgi:hypothetical protein